MDDKSTVRNDINQGLIAFWSQRNKLANKIAKDVIECGCPDCYVDQCIGWEITKGEVFIQVLVHTREPDIDEKLTEAANRLEEIFGLSVELWLWHCKVDHYVRSKSHVTEEQ
jgi:hypothetical protein